jgi:hypothetical protein
MGTCCSDCGESTRPVHVSVKRVPHENKKNKKTTTTTNADTGLDDVFVSVMLLSQVMGHSSGAANDDGAVYHNSGHHDHGHVGSHHDGGWSGFGEHDYGGGGHSDFGHDYGGSDWGGGDFGGGWGE